jgi:catechol 2,3-dioxygenase
MFPFHTQHQMHITKITLLIKNMQNSLIFYKDILGLHLVKSDKTNAFLGTKNEILIHLIEDSNALEASVTLGLYHFALLVQERKDLAYFLVRLKNARYPITGASDHGVSEAIYLDDPDGNGIEIYWDRNAKEWPMLNGNLEMFTERLDLQALINALNPTEMGMDMKITLGHLHLHVDNLDEAHSFFVDCLGFKKMMLYGQNALFIGDGGYHHHLGLNTWHQGSPLCGPRQVGLLSYDLCVPKLLYKGLIHRIHELHIPILIEEDRSFIIDPLRHKVYLNVV